MQTVTMLGGLVTLVAILGIAQISSAQTHGNQPPMIIRGTPSQLVSQQQVDAGKIGPLPSSLKRVRDVEAGQVKIVDLSHPLHNNTLHWPKNKGVTVHMDIDSEMTDPSGKQYHVRSDSINMAIHSGTHLDAPSHFSKDGWSVDSIPLEHLIGVHATIIDLSAKVKANRSYSFLKSDFMKDGEPLVKANTVVLVYTGISQFYDIDHKAYTGADKNSSISLMKSPGFSEEAAHYLAEQNVYGVGLDAISADSSERQADETRYDPKAHRVFNTNNIYILENISKNLEDLVGEELVHLFIAPLPIVNGSGSPVRLIAIVGHEHEHEPMKNGAASEPRSLCYSILLTICFCVLAVMI